LEEKDREMRRLKTELADVQALKTRAAAILNCNG
jgi:hypothetical protein